MKKLWLACAVICLFVSAGNRAGADDVRNVDRVVLNGRQIVWLQSPVLDDGYLLLPADFIEHRLGLSIQPTDQPNEWLIRGFGAALKVAAGRKAYYLNDQACTAPLAPRLLNGSLYVPAQLLATLCDLSFEVKADNGITTCALYVPGANVTGIRHGVADSHCRVVIDLDAATPFLWDQEANKIVIQIPGPAQKSADFDMLQVLNYQGPVPCKVTRSCTTDSFTRIVITHQPAQSQRLFTLGEKPRIVIDLQRPSPPAVSQAPAAKPSLEPQPQPSPPEIAPWTLRAFTTPRGPLRVFVLKTNPAADNVEVRPALAGPTIRRRASVQRIAARMGAVAAINGGYFAAQGSPLGWLVIDGEWIKAPMYGRTAIGFWPDGRLRMGNVTFAGSVELPNGTKLRLEGINQGATDANGIVLYTWRWGRVLAGDRSKTRLVLDDDGRVMVKEVYGRPVEFPRSGCVLSASGRSAMLLQAVNRGDIIKVRLGTEQGWVGVKHALGAGPRLVLDGKPCVTATVERFKADVHGGLSPRSAIGFTRDGTVILAVVEPAAPDVKGVTLDELATIMAKLGAWQAMNLDGGGSSTAVARNGKVINQPGDGRARLVSNAIVVIPKASTPPARE